VRAAMVLAATVLALAPIPALAQAWMEDGKTCFCLKNSSVGVLRGCVGTKLGGDFYVTATCAGGEKGDPTTTLKIEPPWTPIKDGDDGCRPCSEKRGSVKEWPRGPEQ
jgi:hypothetical protein